MKSSGSADCVAPYPSSAPPIPPYHSRTRQRGGGREGVGDSGSRVPARAARTGPPGWYKPYATSVPLRPYHARRLLLAQYRSSIPRPSSRSLPRIGTEEHSRSARQEHIRSVPEMTSP
eukprot:887540-Rhodomonas_salina.1